MNSALKFIQGSTIIGSSFLIMNQLRQKGNSQAQAEGNQTGSNSKNHFFGAYSNIPHIEKRHRGGEDAWIISSNLLAVADGVGGWNRKGVDPGIFARELCSHVTQVFQEHRNGTDGQNAKRIVDINLTEVLVEGVKRTKAMGTSTFVLASIDDDGESKIQGLNLGDSAYMIVRPDPHQEQGFELIFRSKEQQYRFNYPYQCGTNYDPPHHADRQEHDIKHNDVVILGTDGVFDNLFHDQIFQCLKPEINYSNPDHPINHFNMTDPQSASNCIANTAEKFSYDKTWDSPFSKGARAAGRNRETGGKDDDITVIVAQIKLPKIF
ncbi:serine threonine family 2c [Stylonychia lemnae]|uniref:Protein phosphatase n=1 Tax=Stylonychia lemnae TaxID=5949 RepID=A0A077ZTY3_STYLE|nr:serine threonine family 2c [Stylonychia lemnae]|eukprot:CDW72780.1 serine threonine family 2c [Stylonychia lemnae]